MKKTTWLVAVSTEGGNCVFEFKDEAAVMNYIMDIEYLSLDMAIAYIEN